MTNTSNLYRKARALVAKTVAAGCTPAEHVSATNLAATLVKKHGLDAARIDWPAPPAGFAWSGEPGRSVVVEIPAEPTKTKRQQKAKAAPKPAREPKPAAPKGDPKPKRPTQGERVIEMLKQPDGTTIADIMAEFGILPHTARALISVHTRRLGLKAELDRQTKRYRVAS